MRLTDELAREILKDDPKTDAEKVRLLMVNSIIANEQFFPEVGDWRGSHIVEDCLRIANRLEELDGNAPKFTSELDTGSDGDTPAH